MTPDPDERPGGEPAALDAGTCLVCGRALRPIARFCASCGTPRDGTEPPAPSPAAALRRSAEHGLSRARDRASLSDGDPLQALESLRHGPCRRTFARGPVAGGAVDVTLLAGDATVAAGRLVHRKAPLEEPAAFGRLEWTSGHLELELAGGRAAIRLGEHLLGQLVLATGAVETPGGALLLELPPVRAGPGPALSPTLAGLVEKPRRWAARVAGAAIAELVLPPQEPARFAAVLPALPVIETRRSLPGDRELRAALLACALLACAAPDRW